MGGERGYPFLATSKYSLSKFSYPSSPYPFGTVIEYLGDVLDSLAEEDDKSLLEASTRLCKTFDGTFLHLTPKGLLQVKYEGVDSSMREN